MVEPPDADAGLAAPGAGAEPQGSLTTGASIRARQTVPSLKNCASGPGARSKTDDPLRGSNSRPLRLARVFAASIICGEIRGHSEIDVIVRPSLADRELFRHRKHDIRFADPP